jgi:hypothetical protein
MQPTASSASAISSAWPMSANTWLFRAFSASGRFSRISITPSVTSTISVS